MGEGPAGVDFPHGPDAVDARLQTVVDLDEASLVGFDVRVFEAQVRGVRLASDGEQHMTAVDRTAVFRTLDSYANAAVPRLEGDALCAKPYGHTLALENLPYGIGDVLIFPSDQSIAHLDHRHP